MCRPTPEVPRPVPYCDHDEPCPVECAPSSSRILLARVSALTGEMNTPLILLGVGVVILITGIISPAHIRATWPYSEPSGYGTFDRRARS